jgi:hypothetical protein
MPTDGGCQVNCSRKSISGPFSFSRENPISKFPTVVAHCDASTDTTAVHFRPIVGGSIAENLTSETAKAGLHTCGPAACAASDSAIPHAKRPTMRARFIVRISHLPERFCSFAHHLGSCETNVREQMLLIGQLEELVALGAALSPTLQEPQWDNDWRP